MADISSPTDGHDPEVPYEGPEDEGSVADDPAGIPGSGELPYN